MWRTKKIILSGLGVAFIGLAVFSYYTQTVRAPADDVVSFAQERGLVMQDYEGKDVRFSEFRKKFLVVHLWASWCPYCGDELKNLARLKEIYGDDLLIIALNRGEPHDVAREFTDRLDLAQKMVFLLDPNDSFYKEVGGYAMPETVFINADGDVLFHQRGPMKIQEVVGQINNLLK
jgi:thiol-disulfide isomerase/thioredoxin